MTTPNNAGSGAPPAGATDANGTAAGAGTGQMVPITALHEEREKRQALASQVQALQEQIQNLAKGGTQREEATRQAQPTQQQITVEQLDQMWRSDPKAAMRTELIMAVDWADQVNMVVEDQFDTLASRKETADVEKYRAEITKQLRKIPLSQRGMPGVVETAYLIVKGRNADGAAAAHAQAVAEKIKSAEAAGSALPAGGNSGGTQQRTGGLTDMEKAAAAAMGVSEDEYAKFRK